MATASTLDADMPSFMKRRAEAMEEVGAAKAKAKVVGGVVGAAKGKGKKDDDQLKDLVIALGELSVINSAELREMCGMSYVTFLVDSNLPLVKASLEAGVQYNESVKALKAAKEAGGAGAGLEELASPHIAVALAGIKAIIEDIMIPIQLRSEVKAWWDKNILEKAEEEVSLELRSWRCKKPQKQSNGSSKKPNPKDYARLTFSVKDEQGELALVNAIKAMSGVRKVGTAPKGTFEREARRLLDKIKRERG
jgi:hypothetical protein